MITNVGNLDRIIRGVVGVALVTTGSLTMGVLGVFIASLLIAVGTMNILAAVTGTCVLYKLLGFKTCPMEQRRQQEHTETPDTT